MTKRLWGGVVVAIVVMLGSVSPAHAVTWTTQNQATFSTASDVAVGDIDRNGSNDVVVGESNGLLQLYGGLGAGGYAQVVSVATGLPRVDKVAIGKLDGDLDPDVVALDSADRKIAVLWGGGSFASLGQTQFVIGTALAPRGLSLADINRDGNLDIVFSSNNDLHGYWIKNNGGRSFAAPVTTEGSAVGNGPVDVATGDFGVKDGNPDVLIALDGSGAVRLQTGDGRGGFSGGSYGVANNPNAVAVGEINGDSSTDAATTSASTDSVSWFAGVPNVAYLAIHKDIALAAGSGPTDIAAGEVTNDGVADLVTANPGDNTFSVLRSVGGAQPTVYASPSTGTLVPTTVAVGDMNGDGLGDVVLGAGNRLVTALGRAEPVITSTTATDTATVFSQVSWTFSIAGALPAAKGDLVVKLYSDSSCTTEAAGQTDTAVTLNGSHSYTLAPGGNAGTYYWRATYAGDASNAPASTTCGAVTTKLVKATPTVTVRATASVAFGGSIARSASLADAVNPGGSFVWTTYSDASCTTVYDTSTKVDFDGAGATGPSISPPPGTYYTIVAYTGNQYNADVTTPCNRAVQSVVAKATPTLTPTATDATLGGDVSLTTVLGGPGSPTGKVTVKAFADCASPALFTASVASGAAATYTPEHAGTIHWSVDYPGDANNAPAAIDCATAPTSTVAKAAPTLADVSTAKVALGAPITDVATLADGHGAAGSIGFSVYAGTSCSGTALATSSATVDGDDDYTSAPYTPTAGGVYSWQASYGGDADNTAAATACTATSLVTQPGIAVSPASITFDAVTVGDDAPSQTVTVTNSATGATAGDLTPTVTVSGAGLSLSKDTCSATTVKPGEKCTFAVLLGTSTEGQGSGAVTVSSNAGAPVTVAVSGSVRAKPVPTPTPPPIAVIPVPTPTPVPIRPFTLSGLRATRCGTTTKPATLSFTLSDAAQVTYTIERRVKPVKPAPRHCPSASLPAVGGTRGYSEVKATTSSVHSKTVATTAGAHEITVYSLVGSKAKLVPGRYRITVNALRADGKKGKGTTYIWQLAKQHKNPQG